MSTHELLAAINHLPPDERLALLESVVRNLREEISVSKEGAVPVEQVRGVLKTEEKGPADGKLAVYPLAALRDLATDMGVEDLAVNHDKYSRLRESGE